MSNRRKRMYSAPVCLASVFALPKIASATDFAWIGGADSQWSNNNNWNPIGHPSNGDNGKIYGYSPSGNISITVNYDSAVAPASIGTITVSGDGDGSQTLNAATLNIVSGSLSASHELIGIFITSSSSTAEYGRGIVNQSGGTNAVDFLTIGDQQNYVTGAYNLSGTGVLNVGSIEVIGYPLLGNGTFTQSGGTHTAASLNVGGFYNFSAGILSANLMTIGGGTLTQSGGNGTVNTLDIGSTITGPFGAIIPTPGTVSATAGSLAATNVISVGYGAAGTLSVSGTGQVTTPELDNQGTVQLSGGTLGVTTLFNNGTFTWTGGALEAQSGTTFDNSVSSTSVGGLFNASLSLTSNRTLKIDGTETLGSTSGFTLGIPAGGSNIVRQLNISSKGKLNLTGGTLTCTAIDVVGQNQLFNWTAGTLNLLSSVTLDPNASTLTTGGIFGATLALSNRTLTAPNETLTSTVRTATFAMTVPGNGNNLVSGALTVDTLGSLTVGGGTVSAATTNVLGGGKLLYSSGTFLPGAFSVQGTGAATFSAPSSVIVMSSLSVDNTAKLDIGSTKLIIHSTDQTALRTSLLNGYDAGAWDKGLRSSQAVGNPALGIGYLINAGAGGNPLHPTFGGQSATANDTLMSLTYVGDANLDGIVNALDFNGLATNYGSSGKFWSNGDFNYDGTVNSSDFGLLANNFGQVLASGGATPTVQSMSLLVPEPGSVAMLLVGAIASRRRRSTSTMSARHLRALSAPASHC